MAAAAICFLHSSVCARASGTVGDRLAPCVCGPLQCKLQGQAVEGIAGDLSLRIELISLVSHRPLPSCILLYFEGEDHFSLCLHASVLGDGVDCVS